MVNPNTCHMDDPCIGFYLVLLRDYLTGFLAVHREEELKKAVVALGGSVNQRGSFLKSTSDATKISKKTGTTRAAVMFLPRERIDKSTLSRFDERNSCVTVVL